MEDSFQWLRGIVVKIGDRYGLNVSKLKCLRTVFTGRFSTSQRPANLKRYLGQQLSVWGVLDRSGIYFSRLKEAKADFKFPVDEAQRKLCESKAADLAKYITGYNGVLAVGYGLRERLGIIEPSYCLKVHIRSKVSRTTKSLPTEFDGLPVDVVDGIPSEGISCMRGPSRLRKTSKLLCPGLGIGAYGNSGYGTLGVLLQAGNQTNKIYALTVSHLYNGLIDFNMGGIERYYIETHQGLTIDSPDSPYSKSYIGKKVTIARSADTALIDVTHSKRAFRSKPYGQQNYRIRSLRMRPKKDLRVRKVGAYTGLTSGLVTECYKNGHTVGGISFDRVYVVKSARSDRCVAAQGDSGAVWFDSDGQAVGLLVGIDREIGDRAYMVDFQLIVDALGKDIRPYND
ncbi:MAG: hypothetical protein P1V97_39685 [Planctomycetota bacterium]|nr:hypothetical protein [Planctomycetota bacterium]